jgi:transcriptional regulator with XRE-family HTH domain
MLQTLMGLRNKARLSIAEAAELVGVTSRMWRNYEDGSSEIPSGRLVTVARVLSRNRQTVTVDQVLQSWAKSIARKIPEVQERLTT